MNYLVDTCVFSELIKVKPYPVVEKWFADIDSQLLYVSALTLGELQKGIVRLPKSSRRTQLEQWFETSLIDHFEDRVLDITTTVALEWGNLQARTEKGGQKLPAIDSLIAATAIVHKMTVVTRNVTDLAASGVPIFDPWSDAPSG